MPCDQELQVQAYFDGEVDAPTAIEIERHLAGCAECSALLTDLQQTRSAIREQVSYHRAPPQLRARITQALTRERPGSRLQPKVTERSRWSRPFWLGALTGVGGAAVAAALGIVLLLPPTSAPVLDAIVSAHARSLMPEHLIDVVSTDRHTVKPWFAGHADVSPVVVDFAAQGYRLVGGRADYFAHQRAAVVVYEHGAHVINVFSWHEDTRPLPPSSTVDGYHVLCWRSGTLQSCAVSDTGTQELQQLAQLLQQQRE